MPDLNLKELRKTPLPELRLPEMSRDDIAKALGEARKELREVRKDIEEFRQEFEVPRVDVSAVEMPNIDMTRSRLREARNEHVSKRQAEVEADPQGRP